MQLHSTPVSEPVAHFLGLISGLVGFGLAATVTNNHDYRMLVGGTMSVATNLLIGAKINFLMLDILALLLIRPISAWAGVKLLAVVANVLIG